MSITDELRKFIEKRVWKEDYRRDNLLAIADRIDEEHERECKEQYACGAEHGIGASIEASMIQTHGYIELPKDADGVPIRVGDKLRFNSGMIAEVRYLKIDSEGTSVCVLATNGGGDFYAFTDKAHHYHEPTIEDVLRELVGKAQALSSVDDEDKLVADFAKRLTLVGDAEWPTAHATA